MALLNLVILLLNFLFSDFHVFWDFPFHRSIKSIENLSVRRGVESGLKCAEAFKLIRKINTHEKKFTKQYDKRFLKFLEFLRKSSSNAGLSKSDSNTIREMLLFLISKHPTHVDLFNSVLSSIEKYVYGKTPPSNSDFKNFSKSMSVLRS